MGRGPVGSAEVCNSAACATLLHGLKTELVEDEDMGGEKEEPAEAGLNKKEKEKEKKTQKKAEKDESEDPADGLDGPAGGPGGASGGSRGSGLGPPVVAAT
jgi:hypothetical protein